MFRSMSINELSIKYQKGTFTGYLKDIFCKLFVVKLVEMRETCISSEILAF